MDQQRKATFPERERGTIDKVEEDLKKRGNE
jgi:hypothetical protein